MAKRGMSAAEKNETKPKRKCQNRRGQIKKRRRTVKQETFKEVKK